MSPDSGGNVGGGDKSCLTTYIFNPVETCTGTPSPEKFIRTSPGEYFLFIFDCISSFKVDKNVYTILYFCYMTIGIIHSFKSPVLFSVSEYKTT